MTIRIRRRSAVALATVIASLALIAGPVSADGSHNVGITSGTLVLHRSASSTESVPMGGTGTGCGTISSMTNTGSGGAGDLVTVTGFTSSTRFTSSSTGTAYIAEITLTATGTSGIAMTGTTVGSMQLSFRLDVFTATNANPATDCAHATTRSCRLTFTMHFDGSFSELPISTSKTGTFYSSVPAGLMTAPPCAAPFSSLNGGDATLTLNFHLT